MRRSVPPVEASRDLGPVHLVLVEDSDADAELVVRRLRADGLDLYALRVDNEPDFVDALRGRPDIIISDLNLPDFDGRRALALSRQDRRNVPFIVVSGTVTDEEAAKLLDLGATDYILKDRPGRLAAAVRRCLSDRRAKAPATGEGAAGEPGAREAHFRRETGYLRSLLEASLDPLVTIGLDGVVTDVNRAATVITGVPRAELLGSEFSGYFTDPAQARAVYEEVLARGSACDVPLTIRHRDGTLTPVQCNASLYRDADGTPLGVFAAARDVTLQKQAEANFSRLHGVASLGARAHHSADLGEICADATATLAELLPDLDGCELWRCNDNRAVSMEVLTLVSSSPAASPDAALVREVVPGSMVELALRRTGPAVQGSTPWVPVTGNDTSVGSLALTVRVADRAWGLLVAHHHSPGGLPEAEVGLLRDAVNIVSAAVLRADTASSLWHEARHDSLTGLPNRAYLTESLEKVLEGRGDSVVGVAILDVDDFKTINDRYGHEIGDRLLVRVSERLAAATRPNDLVARLGGDEFAVLVPGLTSVAEMEPLVARILTVLSAPLLLDEATLNPRASVGWTTTAESEASVAEMLRGADLAMYEVKRSGKNSAVAFATSMSDMVLADALLADELVAALGNDELVLHYQPQVDLRTGRVSGAEALVRWAHPRRGLLPPALFLATASRLGLMSRISSWVVGEACRWGAVQVAKLAGQPFIVSVNLAATDLENTDLPMIVADALQAAGLEPERLCLEVTESDVLADTAGVEAAVDALRRLGVAMSIDDFGTGYSSLSQMKRLPASSLKVDRGFVDGLGSELDDSAMVSSIISMAHAFSLDVVAEGVETMRQLELLVELGCEYAQGFLFGPPMPGEAALPHQTVNRLLQSTRAAATPRSEGAPATVVIADDLADDRHLLTRALTRSGYFTVVGEASDGDGAVELARVHRPDVVVLDLDMPGGGGMLALAELRANQPETPVVVLTGAASESTRRATLEAGATACLIKGTMDVVPDLLGILRDARRVEAVPSHAAR